MYNQLQNEILDKFEDVMKVKNWTEDTKRNYRSNLKKFLGEYKGSPKRATTAELTHYISSIKGRSAMAQMYGVLKNLYTYVFKQKNKFGFIPFPKKEFKVQVEIPHNEMIDMINSPSNLKHKLILYILYGTGIRISELCKLKWSDIEITKTEVNPIQFIINGKGNKQRKVPVSNSVYEMMILYCKEYKLNCEKSNDFILGGKKPYSHKSVENICRKFTGISPHKIRHLYSQWSHDNGTELETLRQLLGHNSLATVQIYARTKPEKIITPV